MEGVCVHMCVEGEGEGRREAMVVVGVIGQKERPKYMHVRGGCDVR